MVFKPGVSGNPDGTPGPKIAKAFKQALTVAIKRTDGDKTKLAQIAEALVEKAISGDVPAINAIADRLDGKPTQLIAGDEDGAPINIVHGALETLGAKFDRILASSTAQGTTGQLN